MLKYNILHTEIYNLIISIKYKQLINNYLHIIFQIVYSNKCIIKILVYIYLLKNK